MLFKVNFFSPPDRLVKKKVDETNRSGQRSDLSMDADLTLKTHVFNRSAAPSPGSSPALGGRFAPPPEVQTLILVSKNPEAKNEGKS